MGRDFTIIAAGQIMAFLQALILLPIIIRFAGPAVFGAYVLLSSIVGLVFSVLGYGIPYRYQRNVVSAATWQERRDLFEPQFTFHLAALAAVSAAVLLFGRPLQRWMFEDTAQFTPWYFVALIWARLLFKQAVDYFQYTRRFLAFSLGSTGIAYLFVALLAAVAWFARELSLDALLLLQTLAQLLVGAPLAVKLLREIGLPRLRLGWRQFAADARTGLPLTGELIIDFLLRSSDRYLILLYLSVSDVGRYQPAYTVGSIAIFLVSMTDTILVPALSRLVDLGRRDDAAALMATVVRLFLMLSAPMVVGALMTGPSLVGLLATPEIGAASRWVTPLIAAATIFYGVVRLASTAAFVIGRTPAILMANAVGAAANVLLNLALLPLLRSITLPAASALVGYAVDYVYIAWALRTLWPITIDWRAMARYFLASAGMGGLLWYLGFRVGEVAGLRPLALAGAIAAGVVGYFVLLALIGGFGRREMAQLASLARRDIPDAGRAA